MELVFSNEFAEGKLVSIVTHAITEQGLVVSGGK